MTNLLILLTASAKSDDAENVIQSAHMYDNAKCSELTKIKPKIISNVISKYFCDQFIAMYVELNLLPFPIL